MKIILSPTKKMKTANDDGFVLTTPVYLDQTKQLLEKIKSKSFDELKTLLNCNDKIAQLNFDRFQNMDLEKSLSPAILSYDGIAFQYMAPHVFTSDYFDYVQKHLRILSGFYGVLKPFDGICSYRLEMQTKIEPSLYDFWKDDLYQEVMDEDHIILNLASKEYSKCVQKYLNTEDRFVDVVFGEFNEKGKIIEKGVYVKMARGEMVRYMAEHQIENLEEIKSFDRLGYVYYEDLSSSNRFVFIKESEE